MIIGILKLDLCISGCRNLKDKRQILSSLKNRLRDNFNVSVSEAGHQDKWQRAILGIACVGTDKQFVNSVLDKLLDVVESEPRISVADCQMEML
jgi:uncharacterized protein YlxP (DUF503 family)